MTQLVGVFFEKVLNHFGFHRKMVDWIMTYVSTSSFSLCVNEELHGYFNPGGGGG